MGRRKDIYGRMMNSYRKQEEYLWEAERIVVGSRKNSYEKEEKLMVKDKEEG